LTSIVALRLRSVFRRGRVEDELAEELQFHVDEQTRENLAKGMTAGAARDAALRRFGGLEQRKEECRDRRRVGWLEDFVGDGRYALRMMRRSPGFTAVAVMSLALGIGANTAIVSAIDVVMLRPLPLSRPEELHLLQWTAPDFPAPFAETLEGGGGRSIGGTGGGTSTGDMFPYVTFARLHERRPGLSAVVAFSANVDQANVGLGADARSARLLGVSGNYFEGIGVQPLLGRALSDADDRLGTPAMVVVSHAFWQTALGQTPDVLGRVIAVNGETTTIVGVLGPAFFGLEPGVAPDLWIPLSHYARQPAYRNLDRKTPSTASVPFLTNPHIWWVRIAARVTAGASRAVASPDVSRVFEESIGANRVEGPHTTPRLELISISHGIDRVRAALSPSLLLLLIMVVLVLLIACANLAGLLLERASARQRELAVRLSLGVRRSRLVRQLVTESIVLALGSGAAALVIAAWIHPLVMSLLTGGPLPVHFRFQVDARIAGFAVVLSLISAVVFGLAPAWRSTRVTLIGALGQRAVTGMSRGRGLTGGRILVAAQIAVTLILLIAAGLFMRTLDGLHRADLGFKRNNLLLFSVQPGLNGYAAPRLAAYYRELYTRLASTDGVQSVTLARRPPIGGGSGSSTARLQTPAGEAPVNLARHEIGPQYFSALGIELLAGRVIGERDSERAPKAAVINEALARRFFAGRKALGARVDFGPPGDRVFEIVGIVRDVKYSRIRADAPPTIYLSYLQFFEIPGSMTFIVRCDAPLSALVERLTQATREVDPTVPLTNVRTQDEAIDRTIAAERTFATFGVCLGALAMLVSCIGLYGTIAYAVARRTTEIGVRMALGATSPTVLLMVLRDSFRIIAAGILVGIPCAVLAGTAVAARLFGVSPHDVATIATATLLVFAVGSVAALIPARRAARVDPMLALRSE